MTTSTDEATATRNPQERDELPEELRGPLRGEGDETVNLAAFPYGCHVCEIEVDPEAYGDSFAKPARLLPLSITITDR